MKPKRVQQIHLGKNSAYASDAKRNEGWVLRPPTPEARARAETLGAKIAKQVEGTRRELTMPRRPKFRNYPKTKPYHRLTPSNS